ncbi:arylamine N-acetyltransferase family protein [Kordia sp.]|uniref:arylamine N-acetyltransferase family protein n=1 Tax=Kordia sp. TaxID=1965332 RepID=UPI003D2BE5BA
MDISKYLKRIDFHGATNIDENVLFELQRKHLLNIPFENLDIHYGRKINLSINEIYQKIVIHKRGGFCYELNGLFHHFLKQIGFNAKLISARVHTKNGAYSPDYDHLAIIVNIENQEYLVDVGFGKFSLEPLKLQMTEEINDSFGQFKFDKYDTNYYRVNEIINTKLIPQYIFKNEAHKLSEFTKRCNFHKSSENSHFTKMKLISIAKSDGRITLNNSQLKTTHLGIETVIDFDENEFNTKLKQYFDIKIK